LGTIPDPQRINVLAAFATLDLKKQHCWGESSVGFEKRTLLSHFLYSCLKPNVFSPLEARKFFRRTV